ncbi:MAG: flagellar biosynthetic protein FliO [Chloroflexi bacterium]|nr:flagellar biosynthetic protein FliO [Chloroflexota bacterium]
MFDPLAIIQKWLKDSSPRKKLFSVILAFSLLSTGILIMISGSADSAGDPLASTPLYFLSVMVKLVGVLLLIVASAVIFRRWMNLGSQTGPTRQLRLLETVRLSPKQTLYLVAVGDQQLLIGATDQNISLLSPVDLSLGAEQIGGSQLQPGLDFGSMVQSLNSNFPTEPPGGKE